MSHKKILDYGSDTFQKVPYGEKAFEAIIEKTTDKFEEEYESQYRFVK